MLAKLLERIQAEEKKEEQRAKEEKETIQADEKKEEKLAKEEKDRILAEEEQRRRSSGPRMRR